MIVLREARLADVPKIQELLEDSHLPSGDVERLWEHMFVAEERGAVVGVGGLEICGDAALLRSFAVTQHCRGGGIGEALLARVTEHASDLGISSLYLLATQSGPYFEQHGFVPVDRARAPAAIRSSSGFAACPQSAVLLRRQVEPEERARQLFNAGYLCGEAVLMTLAQRFHLDSPMVPAAATGFCSGMSRTCSTCGAVTGAVLGLSMLLGRRDASTSTDASYAAVRALLQGFESEFGSSNCGDLLGVDLGTDAGRITYRERGLRSRCADFTGAAARMAAQLADA